jgi:hypothetical protein
MDLSKIEPDFSKEIIRGGEAYLDGTVKIATSADQRASSLAGMFTAATTALLAAVVALSNPAWNVTGRWARPPQRSFSYLAPISVSGPLCLQSFGCLGAIHTIGRKMYTRKKASRMPGRAGTSHPRANNRESRGHRDQCKTICAGGMGWDSCALRWHRGLDNGELYTPSHHFFFLRLVFLAPFFATLTLRPLVIGGPFFTMHCSLSPA